MINIYEKCFGTDVLFDTNSLDKYKKVFNMFIAPEIMNILKKYSSLFDNSVKLSSSESDEVDPYKVPGIIDKVKVDKKGNLTKITYLIPFYIGVMDEEDRSRMITDLRQNGYRVTYYPPNLILKIYTDFDLKENKDEK